MFQAMTSRPPFGRLCLKTPGFPGVGNPLDITNMVLFLCSDKAGFITGENICIDGGMTRQMIYHNDFGWSLNTAAQSTE